jgi:GTP-binding protein
MLASILDYDPYLGRVLTGRVISGTAHVNMAVHALRPIGGEIESARMTKLLA